MKNKMKKLLGYALAVIITCATLAGCSSTPSDSEGDAAGSEATAENAQASSGDAEAKASSTGGVEVKDTGFVAQNTYKIGYNYYGPGSYALTTLANNQQYVIECMGSEAQSVSDDFQVDKIIQDIENMIAAGCDGLVIWLPADNLYKTVINMCDAAQIPYVFSDKVPSDPEIIAALQESEYFAGAVGPANAEYGTLIAEYALEKGYTSCFINTSAQGDPTDTPRIEAFTEVFEAGGGTIEQVVYAGDTNDTVQQYAENALIAYPDVDFVYSVGSEYGIGAADAIKNQSMDVKVLTSGLDSAILDYLVDESNPVEFVNGDYWISGTMSTVALMNYLDGNPLKDANGNMVFVDNIMPFEITADTYEKFTEIFINNPCYSAAEIQAMNGLYNADFDYDAFLEVIANYSLDERAAAEK